MITEAIQSQPSNEASDNEDSHIEDNISTASSSESPQKYDGTVVLRDDACPELPSFGNISVVNSNDVHLGNKTFYQGPVTIKQFLYATGDKAIDNNDDSESKSSEIVLDCRHIPKGLDNSVFIPDNLNSHKQSASGNKSGTQEPSSKLLKGFQRIQKYSQQNYVILVTLLAVLLATLLILMVVFLLKHSSPTDDGNSFFSIKDSDEQDKETPVDAPLDPETNLTLPNKLKLVPRQGWLAQPPVQPPTPLKLPVDYVIIHHTATENCSSQAQCVFHVRYIQTFHIESRNWWDIGYNFLVGGDGEAYEGRGWKGEGAHLYGYNSRSIGIAFIGTFNTIKPPLRQIVACKRLIEKGLEQGVLKKDYKILAARQLQTTQSPGGALYEEMKTWDHWAAAP